MAWTTTITGRAASLTSATSLEDWSYTSLFANGLRLVSVVFEPSDASDVFVMRNKSATGAKIMPAEVSSTEDARIMYFYDKKYFPVIAAADQTFGDHTAVTITLCWA